MGAALIDADLAAGRRLMARLDAFAALTGEPLESARWAIRRRLDC